MKGKPITERIKRLRQRQRLDGSWRVWWEPEAAVKALGFATVELWESKLTKSARRAKDLNAEVADVRRAGPLSDPAGSRSLSALIDLYLVSRDLRSKPEKTRTDYMSRLKAIRQIWGTKATAAFSKPMMHQWYEILYAKNGEFQALQSIRMMSILFSYAELLGWRSEQSNPCYNLKMHVPKGRDRFATWDEFDQLVASADALGMPDMACAIALSTLQAARQADVINARVAGFKDTHVPVNAVRGRRDFIWTLTRQKRGNSGAMPVHPELEPRLRAMIATAKPGQTYLFPSSPAGEPYSVNAFGRKFAKIRSHANQTSPDIVTLQFRDLRRTFGVWARAGGAHKDDVGDVLGNSAGTDARLSETYMPATYETSRRAVAAVTRPVVAS